MEKRETLKTVDIKGKAYVTVNSRVKYFNEAYPNGKIVTDIIECKDGIALMKTSVYPDAKEETRYFTGYAYEKESSSFINKTSYIENCETSAIGRALGFMGIGVDTSIASAEEVRNAIHQQETPSKPAIRPPEEKPEPKSLPSTVKPDTVKAKPVEAEMAKPEKELKTNPEDKSYQQRFSSAQKTVGMVSYKAILEKFGYNTRGDIKTKDKAEEVLKALEDVSMLAETFDAAEMSEDNEAI